MIFTDRIQEAHVAVYNLQLAIFIMELALSLIDYLEPIAQQQDFLWVLVVLAFVSTCTCDNKIMIRPTISLHPKCHPSPIQEKKWIIGSFNFTAIANVSLFFTAMRMYRYYQYPLMNCKRLHSSWRRDAKSRIDFWMFQMHAQSTHLLKHYYEFLDINYQLNLYSKWSYQALRFVSTYLRKSSCGIFRFYWIERIA